ncbi:MAG: hypothetical protein HQK77_16590 [Desulfobacterales bacterium]|nr:hypothetical protein [Desulfobacterales bacterium]
MNCVNTDPNVFETSAIINLPGTYYSYEAPSYINIAITGVTNNDSLYIGLSTYLDDSKLLYLTDNKVHLGSDFTLLEVIHTNTYNRQLNQNPGDIQGFRVNSIETVAPVKVQIRLPDLTNLIGKSIYIQAISFQNHETTIDKLRASEIEKIMVLEKKYCDNITVLENNTEDSQYDGCPADSVGVIHNDIFSTDLSIQQLSNMNPSGILLCDVNEDGVIDEERSTNCANTAINGIETSAIINLPGIDCGYPVPSYVNIALTGVISNDSVYVGLSTYLDDPNILSLTENKVRLGSDFNLFEVIHTDMNNNLQLQQTSDHIQGFSVNYAETLAPVKVQIQLPDITYLIGKHIYMQVLSFPNHEAAVGKLRVSEVENITVLRKDNCDFLY